MHKLMYTHTLLPAKTPLQMYTYTYVHSYTLTVLICTNACMCRNEDGRGQSPLAPLCLSGYFRISRLPSPGEQKKQESKHQKPGSYPHCTALCWIMLVAKALILWARFPHLQDEGMGEDWNHLGLKHSSLTNTSNGFRVWRAQVQTPASSEAFPSFGSSASYSVTVGSPAIQWVLVGIKWNTGHT